VPDKSICEYALFALDASGHASKPSSTVRISINDRITKPAVTKFTVRSDPENKAVLLSWAYDAPGVQQFRIYRDGPDGQMRLLESVAPGEKQFRDKRLTVNTEYRYSIKAVFRDGAHSPFSKVVKITY
jgi:hypothetical protein